MQVAGRNLAQSAAFSKWPQSACTPIVQTHTLDNMAPGQPNSQTPTHHIPKHSWCWAAEKAYLSVGGGSRTSAWHAGMGAGCWAFVSRPLLWLQPCWATWRNLTAGASQRKAGTVCYKCALSCMSTWLHVYWCTDEWHSSHRTLLALHWLQSRWVPPQHYLECHHTPKTSNIACYEVVTKLSN